MIDDGSTDGTAELLAGRSWEPGARLIARELNGGKGAAVRDGIPSARGTICAILDADLEYYPEDLHELCAPVLDRQANACFGVRGFRGHTAYSFNYVLGNRALTLAANLLFNVYLGDIMTGLKVVRTDVLRALPLRENGFAIEPEITARLLARGERIYEVPVRYTARTREEGKKLTWVDGFRVLRTLVRCRLDSR